MKGYEEIEADIAAWKAQGIEKAELMTLTAEDHIGYPYAWGASGQLCTVKNREARMKHKKISDGDIALIKKHCQILSGKSSKCDGCKYYPNCKRTKLRDCIYFIKYLLSVAGIECYGSGCSIMRNHNANWVKKGHLDQMPETPCLVFQWVKGNEKKMQHVGYYIGGGYVIHDSVEVKKQKIGDYPWSHYAIPKGMGGVIPPGPGPVPVKKPTIKRKSRGDYVKECQGDLLMLGYDVGPKGAAGIFGQNTEAAVKKFQMEHKDLDGNQLKADGIVGPKTWGALDNAVGKIGTQDVPAL